MSEPRPRYKPSSQDELSSQDEFAQATQAGSIKAYDVDVSELRLADNKQYQTILKECDRIHRELLKYERDNKSNSYIENPALIGQYLGQLRLHANLLFSYMNTFIDLISDMELNYAENRKRLFMEALNETDSPNKSESIAREKTRVLEAKIGMMKANLNQIRNSYENYNSICMYLMSRNKEFISERIMG